MKVTIQLVREKVCQSKVLRKISKFFVYIITNIESNKLEVNVTTKIKNGTV